jgi:hypothetical protein
MSRRFARATILFGMVLVVRGVWAYAGFDVQRAPYFSVAMPASVGTAIGVVLIVAGYFWERRLKATS